MLLQEGLDLRLVFLRQHRAGGIHQQAAGANVAAHRVQQLFLGLHDGGKVAFLQAQLDIRLLAQYAGAGAGRVQQHRVQRFFHVRAVLAGVLYRRTQVVQPQTAANAVQQERPLCMQLPRVDPARQLHDLAQIRGFASRSRARVQNFHAGPGLHRFGGQHAALTLNGIKARLIIRVKARLGHALQQIGMGSHACPEGQIFFTEQVFKTMVVQLEQIGPDGDGMTAFPVQEHPLRRFEPVGIGEFFHQPQGRGAFHMEPFLRVFFRIRPRELVLLADQIAQHRVHKACGGFHAHRLDQLHGFVHGGAVRNPLQKQNLVNAQPQRVPSDRVPGGILGQLVQSMVDLHFVFQRAVHQLRGQAALLGLQVPGQIFVQAQRGIGAVFMHVQKHLQRQLAGTGLCRRGRLPGAGGLAVRRLSIRRFAKRRLPIRRLAGSGPAVRRPVDLFVKRAVPGRLGAVLTVPVKLPRAGRGLAAVGTFFVLPGVFSLRTGRAMAFGLPGIGTALAVKLAARTAVASFFHGVGRGAFVLIHSFASLNFCPSGMTWPSR